MKRTAYIFSDGEIKRKDGTVILEMENGRNYLPVEEIGDVFVFGEVSLSKKIIELAAEKELVFHFFNYYDYYVGSYYPREHYNSGYMILNQAQAYSDAGHRLRIASSFIKGSCKNMLQVLKYYKIRGKELDTSIEQVEDLEKCITGVSDVESLMGIEGNIRDIYYRTFDSIVDSDEFTFERRSRRPPKNRMNSLISFGNSILYSLVLSEIYKTHLDPRIGFLHTTNNRRFTLNLDVAEVFKPVLVDRAIFTLVSKNMLDSGDFEKKLNGILLNDKGRKTFVKVMEDKLKATIKHKELGRSVSYRRLIRMELYKIEKDLIGEKEYTPFISGW